ncbi:MAG: glycosyltransferase family 39 protein, partial [Firmicutes bacterium]|nr:glycosyltransferase family 39 protein [Bacillota bacterium]
MKYLRKLFAYPKGILWGIMLIAAAVRLIGFGRYHGLIYDEYYYVPAALTLLSRPSPVLIPHAVPGIDPNLLSAPPFAKEVIAASIWIFGNHAWAWRLPGEILGILAVGGLYALTRDMFQSRATALVAAGLAAVDGLMITMSRVALLDSIAFPLVVLNGWMLWRLSAALRRGQAVRWPHWAGWGILLGLGLSAKWIGAQTILLAWVWLAGHKKFWPGQPLLSRWMAALSVTFVPLVVYFLTYFYAWPSGFHQSWLPRNFFIAWAVLQKDMVAALWDFRFYQPWTSSAWSWIAIPRPTLLLQIVHHKHIMRLMAFSDPLVIWTGLLGLIQGGYDALVRRKNGWIWLFLWLWLGAFYGTWLLTPRSKFTYYFLSAMVAVIIAAAHLLVSGWRSSLRIG